MSGDIERHDRGGTYLQLLRNPTFVLLWSGQTISTIGDAVFNVAVMWLVYVQTGSALQTGIISVLYTLSSVIIGPIAGVYADRWNRKWTMAGVAFLSAVIVSVATIPLALAGLSPLLIYVTVVLLNVGALFYSPARSSVMPEIVGRDLMVAAGGLFSLVNQGTSLIGAALAGLILAVLGATWALVADAGSFLVAAVAIAVAHIPGHARWSGSLDRPSLVHDLRDGWRVARGQPVLWAFIRIAALVNVVSYMGPLFPALVRLQMHGDVKAYGFLEAASVVGGMAGGLAAGSLERRVGTGRLIGMSFTVGGLCFTALGISSSVLLGGALFLTATFFLIAADVSMGALTPLLIPEEYRGRVSGLLRATAVVAMPATILLGGWLADRVGPGPLYVFGGLWAVGVGFLAWSSPHLRTARITLRAGG